MSETSCGSVENPQPISFSVNIPLSLDNDITFGCFGDFTPQTRWTARMDMYHSSLTIYFAALDWHTADIVWEDGYYKTSDGVLVDYVHPEFIYPREYEDQKHIAAMTATTAAVDTHEEWRKCKIGYIEGNIHPVFIAGWEEEGTA